jgi:hypothetical protein
MQGLASMAVEVGLTAFYAGRYTLLGSEFFQTTDLVFAA